MGMFLKFKCFALIFETILWQSISDKVTFLGNPFVHSGIIVAMPLSVSSLT